MDNITGISGVLEYYNNELIIYIGSKLTTERSEFTSISAWNFKNSSGVKTHIVRDFTYVFRGVYVDPGERKWYTSHGAKVARDNNIQ